MVTECQDITVHATSFAHRGGPVFHASLPGDGETGNGCGANRAADQKRLVTTLWNHVGAMDNPRWLYRHVFDRAASPLQVAHGPLGRPHLLLGEVRGPAVSFSEGGGKIWAALCGDGSDIGIDVAAADEFQGDYPLHRVFHDQELHHAVRLTGGDRGQGSGPALVDQGSGGQGPGMRIPSCGSAAGACLSIGRRGLGIYVPGELVGKGPDAVPPGRPPFHMGPFVSP